MTEVEQDTEVKEDPEIEHEAEPERDSETESGENTKAELEQSVEAEPGRDPKAEQDVSAKQRSEEGQAAIARLSKPIKKEIALGQILTILSGILAVAPYAALVALSDVLLEAHRAGVSPDHDRVMNIVFVLVLAFSLRLTIYFAALLVTHFADLKLRDQLRRSIASAMAKAPLSWFSESNSGFIRKAVQDDTVTVHTVIAHGPIEKIDAIIRPVALMAFAFVVDWRLGFLSIATIPLYIFTYSFSLKGMAEKTVEMDIKLGKVSSTMVEFVSGISVVKAFGQSGKAHKNYLEASDDFADFYLDWCKPLINVSVAAQMWISVPVLLLVNLGGGALLMNAGLVNIGQVLATTLIALVIPAAIMTISSITWSYQLAGSAAERVCSILDLEPLPQTDNPQEPEGHRVEIDNVHYSYGETKALDGVSLTLEPGTVTALLGPSGSGKSTLATLVARFDDPQQGAIRIGGVDLRDMSEETLYRNVSFVLQDAQLLMGPIKNNISLGKPDATLDEIRQAAQIAQIDDYIMSLPDGYDTVLGEETSLSGGQEQRIAIARAVLVDAPILILDEATAFADPESEADIQQALSTLVRGRTVLVIAHRPGSIRGANQIAVMDRGKLTAVGTHDQIADDEHYQALIKQSGALTLAEMEGSHV